MLGALVAATMIAGCDTYDNGRPGHAGGYSHMITTTPILLITVIMPIVMTARGRAIARAG